MERLKVTSPSPWREIEILQWMERNTLVYDRVGLLTFLRPLNSNYKSECRIAELVGRAELRG